MSALAADLTEKFVEIIRQHPTQIPDTLSGEQASVVAQLLFEAGFQFRRIEPGRLRGRFRNEDGWTNDTYSINVRCSYQVIGLDEKPDERITGWLEELTREAMKSLPTHTVESVVSKMVEDARPLEPIRLTREDDRLIEDLSSLRGWGRDYVLTHKRDHHEIAGAQHDTCGGKFRYFQINRQNHVLVCGNCQLRLLFPLWVQTFRDLRKYQHDNGLA